MGTKTYNARIYVEKENYFLKYYISNKDFKSLNEIISYYRTYPVFRTQKLTVGLKSLLQNRNDKKASAETKNSVLQNGKFSLDLQKSLSINDVSVKHQPRCNLNFIIDRYFFKF